MRVVLAFSKDETARKIKRMLDGSGHSVAMICHSRAELMRGVSGLGEALVIMGYKLPDAVVDDVYRDLAPNQRLLALVKAQRLELIANRDIFTATLPISRQELISAIEVLIGDMPRRKRRTTRTPEEESIIEKAKLYLIEKHNMTEESAHRFIQKRSMDTGARFVDTAKQILDI